MDENQEFQSYRNAEDSVDILEGKYLLAVDCVGTYTTDVNLSAVIYKKITSQII